MKRRQFIVYLGVGSFLLSAPFATQAMFESARRACMDQLAPGTKFKNTDELWRPAVGRSQLMALRANAPHYWAWSKLNAKKFFKKKVLESTGVVVGDPHLKNFSVVWLGDGLSPWRVVDIDDGGLGSLVLDFAIFLHRSKLSSDTLKANAMWKAYLRGLKGKSGAQPRVLKDSYGVSVNRFAKREARKVDKWLTEEDKINFNKKDELTSIDNLSEVYGADKLEIYNEDRAAFEKDLRSDGYKIIDVAYKEKDKGGSQGLPRFVYVLEKEGSRTILEFKNLTDAATAEYMEQESHADRFLSLVKYYWPTAKLGEFKVVEGKEGRVYLRRPKQPLFFEINDKPKKAADTADFEDMAIFTANFLGLAHGAQNSGKALLALMENEDQRILTLTAIKGFIGAYDTEVRRLREKNGEVQK